MARKTVGYIKLQWSCPNCGTKNPGPNKFCMGCGAAQPEDVHFEAPERQDLIKDEEELEKSQGWAGYKLSFLRYPQLRWCQVLRPMRG